MSSVTFEIPLRSIGHAGHVKRCLSGLPASQVEIDCSRVAVAFYSIGSLDILGLLQAQTTEADREQWRQWLWEQQTNGPYGTGFRPSPFMTPPPDVNIPYTDYNIPHIIMTYTALLTLAILRDDFKSLDREGIIKFLKTCQRNDGSFSTVPDGVETDLRSLYCAFAICSMLDNWSGVDVAKAVAFIASCRTYEGGYGQSPFCEAQGGTTYTAIAAMHLAPEQYHHLLLSPAERQLSIRWLLQNQDITGGGFCGRTNKEPDACYCFWCGASLQILGAQSLVDAKALGDFLERCQFKFGGISKAVGEMPDPYHTYLSLAALSIYASPNSGFDPLLNATKETAEWARRYIPANDSEQ